MANGREPRFSNGTKFFKYQGFAYKKIEMEWLTILSEVAETILNNYNNDELNKKII